MKLKVKGLRAREKASGIRFYWQPTPDEAKAGWRGFVIGSDLLQAVAAAEKRNQEIADWKEGGAKPSQIRRHRKRSTIAHGIQRYREQVLVRHSVNSQRTAETPLKRLEAWAGDEPIARVTRQRVIKLRNAMMKPKEEGGIGHHPAFHVLERGRSVWKFFVDEGLATENPFLEFGLGRPAPRQTYWEDRHVEAITATAAERGEPMVALAVELGLYCGQRENDILTMPISAWREIPRTKFRADPQIWETLAADATSGPDMGKVMGLYVRQGKTKRWVGIPIEGKARRRIEAAIRAARANGRMTILGNDRDGKPWNQDNFIDRFGKVRAAAAERARMHQDHQLATELEGLWYGDLRRSCVVFLGELGLDDAAIAAITGHSLASVKSILETYMPRNEGMAARAIMARREARSDNVATIGQGRKTK